MKEKLFKIYNLTMQKVLTKPRYYKVLSGPLKNVWIYTTPRHGIKKIVGNYENRVMSAIGKYVKVDDVAVDVGSHIGYISLYMRLLVGSGGKVLSFEPLQEPFDYLNTSIKKNKFTNMETFRLALGNKTGKGSAHVFADSGMANFNDSGFVNYNTGDKNLEFPIDTLDSVLTGGKTKIDFMKLDVEGYEANVLEGAEKTIAADLPTMLIEVHNQDNYDRAYKFLTGYGYKIVSLDEISLPEGHKLGGVEHVVAVRG